VSTEIRNLIHFFLFNLAGAIWALIHIFLLALVTSPYQRIMEQNSLREIFLIEYTRCQEVVSHQAFHFPFLNNRF
jgi:hypothetical protein